MRRPGTAVASLAMLACAVAATLAIYLPGLHGDFLLDDYQNLKTLAELGTDSSLIDLLHHALTDVSGPAGRPVSLFSFALQHGAWPDDPVPFKAVNLAIHVLTGILLVALFHRLGGWAGLKGRRISFVALLAGALWMLAPIQVSTVLYVVQRMTQLAALFTVASVMAWLHGRERLSASRPSGWVWMMVGAGAAATMAVLSKETGVLVPLYLLVIEGTLLQSRPLPRLSRRISLSLLWLPVIVVASFAAWRYWASIAAGFELRDFSVSERLLTQARVVLQYLRMALMPDPSGLGLFHDDYTVSRALNDPLSTLPAVFGLALAVIAAVGLRRRAPVLSFGVLWFLVGHSLESSVLPLELYFEHRNYLPIAGLMFAVAYYAVGSGAPTAKDRRLLAGASVGLLWVTTFAWITWNEARLWGNPALQAVVWAQRHPESVRAQERLGALLASQGKYVMAAERFRALAESGDPAAYVTLWKVGCFDESVEYPPQDEVVGKLAVARTSNGPVGALEQIVLLREEGECKRLAGSPMVLAAFGALSSNPRFASKLDALLFYEGRWRLANGDLQGAIMLFEREYLRRPSMETAIILTRLTTRTGDETSAKGYLSKARALREGRLVGRRMVAELADLERRVESRFSQ